MLTPSLRSLSSSSLKSSLIASPSSLVARHLSTSPRTMSSLSDHQKWVTSQFSVSGASGLYDRARPTYPPQAISHLLSLLPSHNASVLELGAGTGLFTRALLAGDAAGGRISTLRAVEPSEGMREGFEKALREKGVRDAEGRVNGGRTEVTVEEGTFASVKGVEDGSVDLVVIAQAFHWTGSDGAAAVDEIARVLKPGGTWAKIWNLEDGDKSEWVRKNRELYEEFEAGTPQYRLGLWKSIWTLPHFSELFTSPEQHLIFNQSLPATEDLVVDRVFSKSYITALGEEERRKLEGEIREVVKDGVGKVQWKGEGEGEGVFEYPYKTDLFITTRK